MNASSTLAAALESALDLYLRQDPENAERAARLQGSVIALSVTGTGITLYFLPDASGVQVLGHYEGDVTTHLSGSPAGFARLALDRREDALFQGAVKIDGDAATGQQFQALLADTDLDWEELLSRVTGDVIAHQAGRVVAHLRRALREGGETLANDTGEYLQEEARLLPTAVEVRYFLDDVDRLRDDAERLQTRVERLQRALDAAS